MRLPPPPLLLLLLAQVGLSAWAQQGAPSAPASAIFTCVDERGRRLTSDRPIPECIAREQRVLNRDGSLRGVRPPTLTPEEVAEKEARARQEAEARAAQADAARRDRNLLQRYKTEATHQKAREAALESVRAAIRAAQERTQALQKERKPLLDEAEFYKGKPLPAKLKQQVDANDAALEAQRATAATQQAELDRINQLYDAEIARLKALWAGATPGSLGPLPGAGTAAATVKPTAQR